MYDMYDMHHIFFCMYDMYDMYGILMKYMCDIKLSHIPVICVYIMYIYIIYLSDIYHISIICHVFTRYICISNVILSIHVHLTYRIYLQTNTIYIYIYIFFRIYYIPDTAILDIYDTYHIRHIYIFTIYMYTIYIPYIYIYIYTIYIYILILLHTTYIDLYTIQPFLSLLELPTSPGHQWRPSTRSWPAPQTHPLLPPSLFCFLCCCLSRSGISWMCAWSLPESWNRIFTTTK